MQVQHDAVVTGKNERGAFLDVMRDGQVVPCVMPKRKCPDARWLDGSSSEAGKTRLKVVFMDKPPIVVDGRTYHLVSAATRLTTDWRALYELVLDIYNKGESFDIEVTGFHPQFFFAEITCVARGVEFRAKMDRQDFPGAGPEDKSKALEAFLLDFARKRKADQFSDVDVVLLEPIWDDKQPNRPLLVKVLPSHLA